MAGRLVFGTTGSDAFLAEITSINWSGLSRESIDQTHTASPDNYKEFDPSTLVDPGELEVELNFDPDTEPPIEQAKGTLTITFPLASGQISAATWAGAAFMTSIDVNGSDVAGKFTASTTWKFSGPITFTAGS